MTTEERILEKLNQFEEQFGPILKANQRTQELKKDITPLLNKATAILINEMLEVESSFQLDHLFDLIKQLMRSTRNLTYVLKRLDGFIDFINDMSPLLKSAVPILIGYLDDLEKRGVLRIIKSTLDIRAKVASAYDHNDIDKIGDGIVALLGFAKFLANPKTSAFINQFLDVIGTMECDQIKPVGPGGLMTTTLNPEFKKGLGIILELTKSIGRQQANVGNPQ